MNRLQIIPTLTNGVTRGLKSFPALIVNGILFLLTVWIPYINIGTIIGMTALPAKIARDEGLSFVEIFNPDYRKYMGDFFLGYAFLVIGVTVGLLLAYVPGIILGVAWSQAMLLIVDKHMDPIGALRKSNEVTYGNKWAIFLAPVILMMGVGIVFAIFSAINDTLGLLVGVVLYIGLIPMILGINAEIYRTLVLNEGSSSNVSNNPPSGI